MTDGVWNRPIMQCKPLIIDYVMYAYGLFSCNARVLHTSIDLAMRNLHLATIFYQLLFIGPFPTKLAPKKVFSGHFGPQVKFSGLRWPNTIFARFCWCDSAHAQGLQKTNMPQHPHYLCYFSPIEHSVLIVLTFHYKDTLQKVTMQRT